ncbi:MAG: M2 family metallopeptidase [Chiayiivirga sp.]|uniref:M2 family metallopeptidase n=1 Tax=Chiayiivirga sp. TaxID=2041042 RepID=UPI0025BA9F17|nr:M2 family metallopeptidase [Chiayiivirga sp.]MCI1709487.1 M2 family metallopeptidase [Chiayiivirga sp.]MCI1730224.1 M2 family metallopeptidase [Chiayiivirga sp.]
MKVNRALLALAVSAALVALSACESNSQPKGDAPEAAAATPTAADADAFVARVNEEAKADYPEAASAQWIASTYINSDSQLVAAKANERSLAKLGANVEASKQYSSLQLKPETARGIHLLKLATSMPAPKDPKKLSELTQIATKMEGMYGSGQYCTGEGDARKCRPLGELEDTLRSSRDYDAQLDAWQGWHTVSPPMRADYQRFAELINEGSKELGFANAGEMWRAGYDMSPADFEKETDRLWDQVKPLYEDLHCYVKGKLETKYGDKGSVDGMIPAHLTGNMWAQQWGNIWDLVEPYKNAGSLDITGGLEKQKYDHVKMVQRAEDFYTSLGMPALPKSFYEKSQLLKPRDRDVVCHASAWDMNYQGDVRIKMCIQPNEDEFTTIYHELGHVYYYLAYNHLPPMFQSGAHDGFHEAIGDTIVLSMTPKYLSSIGLVDEPRVSQESLINGQLKMALDKVAFLPFGKLIDQWRWAVFDGRIKPEDYNKAWWELRKKYQGVAPATARGEEFFDPGAKYHVPGNTPYTRYFLSHVLQFQFYKALCDASGHTGPLHECSFYGNKEAGAKYWAMMQKGQGQPWQQTMKELTGGEQMDASAILDYFAPLQGWLKEQNQGKTCGW